MPKERKREHQWHDGFFRFVLNRERDCVTDLAKLAEQYGGLSALQALFAWVDWGKVRAGDRCFF